jgi:hypothetical protein
LDPTEVALKNDGCRGHDWDWVTRYQKENGFPQRWSLGEVIAMGKKAIGWEEKWHPPGVRKLANGRMHGLDFMHVNEWHWPAPVPGVSFACLALRHGKAANLNIDLDVDGFAVQGSRLDSFGILTDPCPKTARSSALLDQIGLPTASIEAGCHRQFPLFDIIFKL